MRGEGILEGGRKVCEHSSDVLLLVVGGCPHVPLCQVGCVAGVVVVVSWFVVKKEKKRGVLESGGELGQHIGHVDWSLDVGDWWCDGMHSHGHQRDGGWWGWPPTTSLGCHGWARGCACMVCLCWCMDLCP